MTFPKKSLGQNFLVADDIVEEIADALPLKGKTVLEIGAGKGILTAALAQRAKKVVALEIDERLAGDLEESLKDFKNVELIFTDAMEYDFSPYEIVFGNVPYYIASPLLFKIIASRVKQSVLLFQEEFAERLIAEPCSGDYSRLSVMVQSLYDCEAIEFVSRECFLPQPRVDSVLVKLSLKKQSEQVKLNEDLVRAVFQHKNQSLRNALKHSSYELKKEKKGLMEFADSLPKELCEQKVRCLSLQELQEISEAFHA